MSRILFDTAQTVIVGNGETHESTSVLVENGVIKTIDKDIPTDTGMEVVDCRGKTVMPGLIDAHTHIAMWAGEVDWGNILDTPDEYLAARAVTYLSWWIRKGFTTVFDALARNDLPFELRRALRDGIINGPRMLVAGPAIVATGARGQFFGPLEVSGEDSMRKAAREQVSIYRNADVVKIMSTSEMLTGHVESRIQLTQPEVAVAVEEAHRAGVPVHCHAYGGPGVEMSVKSGVDLIIHGQPIGWEFDPELEYGDWQTHRRIDGGRYASGDYMGNYDLMAEKGVFWAPTLSYYYRIYNHHWDEFKSKINPFIVGRAKLVGESLERNFRLAHEAGVPIVLGTDAGMPFTHHGYSAWEMGLYVEYGMSPAEAIQAATLTAAKCLWIDDRTGSLEAGKKADMLVLSENPLNDVGCLTKDEVIERVYLEGELRAENGVALPVTRETMLAQLEKLETLDELLTHRSPYSTGSLGKKVIIRNN